MRSSNGALIISCLFAIGGDSSGTLHCIMSVSHTKLQRLCYAKLSRDELADFPNYKMHLNLNQSKVHKVTIAPFTTPNSSSEI